MEEKKLAKNKAGNWWIVVHCSNGQACPFGGDPVWARTAKEATAIVVKKTGIERLTCFLENLSVIPAGKNQDKATARYVQKSQDFISNLQGGVGVINNGKKPHHMAAIMQITETGVEAAG